MTRQLFSTAPIALALWLAVSCGGRCAPDPGPVEPQRAEASAARDEGLGLVLTIVIDGLRADAIATHRQRFGEGGFTHLIENGAWFTDARFPYCTTLTAVGHASIHTGATPAEHGIVSNYWFDRQTGEPVKSVEGPSQDRPGVRVTGPVQLTATTVGDELVRGSGGRSRVFSVAVKDRGAILPGGKLGKAFWFSKSTGEFVTSSYYYPDDGPGWLAEWNRRRAADRYQGSSWELLAGDAAAYVHGTDDDRPEEKPYNEPFGRSAAFPHSLVGLAGAEFRDQLRHTPFADELTLDLVERLVREERLGRRGAVDMLALSFSATDAIGHAWGPASLEYEDNLLRVDRLLARLFRFVDDNVGLERTLIALTADHGVDMIPEYRQRQGERAGRIDPADLARAIDRALQQKYETRETFFRGFRTPSIYLEQRAIEELGVEAGEVEAEAARAALTVDGIAAAVTRTDLIAGRVPDDRYMQMLAVAFHPQRSGDVLVLQERYYYLYHHHDRDSAMHGSPYDYDTHVPLFLAGPGIDRRVVDRPVSPLDIAPTLANMLGLPPPSGSRGALLTEVLP